MVTFIAGLVVLIGIALWVIAAVLLLAAPDPNAKRIRETIMYLVILGIGLMCVGMTAIIL